MKKITQILFLCFSLIVFSGCGTVYNLNTPQGQQNTSSSVRSTSYYAFSHFLNSKDKIEGKKLAYQIKDMADKFKNINVENDNIIKEVSLLILDINKNYPEELRIIAEDITTIISNQLNTEPIDRHYYLVRAAAIGASQATEIYLKNANSK